MFMLFIHQWTVQDKGKGKQKQKKPEKKKTPTTRAAASTTTASSSFTSTASTTTSEGESQEMLLATIRAKLTLIKALEQQNQINHKEAPPLDHEDDKDNDNDNDNDEDDALMALAANDGDIERTLTQLARHADTHTIQHVAQLDSQQVEQHLAILNIKDNNEGVGKQKNDKQNQQRACVLDLSTPPPVSDSSSVKSIAPTALRPSAGGLLLLFHDFSLFFSYLFLWKAMILGSSPPNVSPLQQLASESEIVEKSRFFIIIKLFHFSFIFLSFFPQQNTST